MASPVASQCQSCHIVKDSPQVDGGIGLIFATIGCFFGVQFCILRSSFRTSRKRNPLLGRLLPEIHDNLSPFFKYENTGTLSLALRLVRVSLREVESSSCSKKILIKSVQNEKRFAGTIWQ